VTPAAATAVARVGRDPPGIATVERGPALAHQELGKLYTTLGQVTSQLKKMGAYAEAHPERPELALEVGKLAGQTLKVMRQFGHDRLTNKAGRQTQIKLDTGLPADLKPALEAVEQGLVLLPGQLRTLHAIAGNAR